MSNIRNHVKNHVKNQVKQTTSTLRNADCCEFCIHSREGFFSDTRYCKDHDVEPFKWHVCDEFERRE